MKARSPAEIVFRLRQEAANLRLFLNPPRVRAVASLLPLPDPAGAAPMAADAVTIAESVLARTIPLLGYEITTPREIRWRRDYVHQRETEPEYFRRIPYLDFERVGDHKLIWELNRHQHLVVMAQASLLTGRTDFVDDVFYQIETWLDQNPPLRGINWTSALEVAFRAFSWIWIHHLIGDRAPDELSRRWLTSLYHHGCYLERNLSIYFSPNTHLQGEALALHALGMLFRTMPRAARWRELGHTWMLEMMETHVHPDGGHFEQSSYYHVYALDMFLFHAVLEPVPEPYTRKLAKMASYLRALVQSEEMPLSGDDDGGRLFHPYGERRRFANDTLARYAAQIGEAPVSMCFPDTGTITVVDGASKTEAIVFVKAFGPGSAGHSHAHALHFTLRHGGVDVLIDPGTYTYVSDPVWRDRFRGTAAHNTVRIDRLDQADPAGPFRWENPPDCEILHYSPEPWECHARCRYRGLSHERHMRFSDDVLWVADRITGAGKHRLEQFWHPAGPAQRLDDQSIELPTGLCLKFPAGIPIEIGEGGEFGWYSPVPGVKLSRPLIRATLDTELPCWMVAAIVPLEIEGSLRAEATPDGGISLQLGKFSADFSR